MKRIFIITNILLVSLIFLAGWKFFRVLSSDSILPFIEESPPLLKKSSSPADRMMDKSDKKKSGAVSGIKFEIEGEKSLPSKESFAGAIEKNLFHTQRREGAEEIKIEPTSTSQSPPKPIIIEGIVIFKNYRAAVIRDTASQAKGGRPTRRVRVGDTIENQQIIAIMEDRLIIKDEDGERVIKLHDSDKPQRPQIVEKPAAAPSPPPPSS